MKARNHFSAGVFLFVLFYFISLATASYLNPSAPPTMKTQLFLMVFLLAGFALAENVDPYNADEQYGWSESIGWLNAGNVPGNFNGDRSEDMQDYATFASHWQDLCPDGWQLK